MYKDELYHYGVKGMKWGVRKDPDRASRGTRARDVADTYLKITSPGMYYGVKGIRKGTSVIKKKAKSFAKSKRVKDARNSYRNLTGSTRSKALSKARRQNIDKMSNQELQDSITRLNLERQYRSLTKVNITRGQKHASDLLKYESTYKAVKKSAAYETGKKVVGKAITKGI